MIFAGSQLLLTSACFICCTPQVVEWLLVVVNHLPSEDQCQKCLVAPVDDKEKYDDIMLGRTKCYDLVTKVGVAPWSGEGCLLYKQTSLPEAPLYATAGQK